jgi:hypothetical protein
MFALYSLDPTVTSSLFMGFGPALERADSERTSSTATAVSHVKQLVNKKPLSNSTRPVSNHSSWSNEISASELSDKLTLAKKVTPISDTWDTSSITQSDDADDMSAGTVVAHKSKSKPVDLETLQTTKDKPVSKSLGIGYMVIGPSNLSTSIRDDSAPLDTIDRLTNVTGVSALVKQLPVMSPRSAQSTWDDSQMSRETSMVHDEQQTRPTSPSLHTSKSS